MIEHTVIVNDVELTSDAQGYSWECPVCSATELGIGKGVKPSNLMPAHMVCKKCLDGMGSSTPLKGWILNQFRVIKGIPKKDKWLINSN